MGAWQLVSVAGCLRSCRRGLTFNGRRIDPHGSLADTIAFIEVRHLCREGSLYNPAVVRVERVFGGHRLLGPNGRLLLSG